MGTVLTVDDSTVVRSVVARHLQRYGCTVIEAADGEAGVAMARAHRPDLVLLDVTMPVMDGRQALAALRSDGATKDLPIIMLTAESGRDFVIEMARLGVRGVLVKPFHQDGFDAEVSKVLGAPGAVPATDAASAGLDPTTVLVVDDSPKVLALAQKALADGLNVLTAASGADAIAEFARARPAVVIVDLVMPGMDGFATLAELRKAGRPTCLALAVRGETILHERAKKAGFAAVIEKPFRGAELLEQVQRAARVGTAADDITQYVSEDDGCPVFRLPDPSAKTLAKLTPLFGKKLRALAEDGNDKLILDVAQLPDVTSEHVAMLVRLLTEAGTLGIRTAICAPDQQIVRKLQQIAETREARYAANRDAARQCLQ